MSEVITEKKAYSSPVLLPLELKADEVLGFGCKTITGGGPTDVSGCAADGCNADGS